MSKVMFTLPRKAGDFHFRIADVRLLRWTHGDGRSDLIISHVDGAHLHLTTAEFTMEELRGIARDVLAAIEASPGEA